MRVLLTGATGFIGGAIITSLIERNISSIAAVRSNSDALPLSVQQVVVGNILSSTDWKFALEGVSIVIHAAARAHVVHDSATDPLAEFRRVNLGGTMSLARQASAAGVKRFIFLSSVGVNGTFNELPFSEYDIPSPDEDYAISKLEAEQGLQEIASSTGMEVVIIRPPLVYGPNAPGNFGRLMRWMHKGIPLPFGAVYNKRSFIALDNLVSFILHCIDHPKAANEVFLISDGEDISTTELLRMVALLLGKKPRLLPVHVRLMEFVAKLLGKEAVSNRLFGSLRVDSSKAFDLLGWEPVITIDEQLAKMIKETQKAKI